MHHLCEQESESRDELVHEARKTMLELVQQMKTGICDHPEAENLMAMQLQHLDGKKSYGYLPKKQKALVDKIVDQMERINAVRECYEKWLVLQGNVYADALLRRENEHLPPNVFLGINRLLHHMSRIFQDNSLPQARPGGIRIDRKRLKRLQEKRAALGQKGNVYEEYNGPTMSM